MAIYYLDSVSGDDNQSGTTENLAWQTLNAVQSHSFTSGDVIKLKRGSLFNHAVTFSHGGTYTMLIVNTGGLTFEDYGTGDIPIISGEANGMMPMNWISAFGSKDNMTFRNIKFFNPGDDGSYRILMNTENCNGWLLENCHFDCNHVWSGTKKVSCLTQQSGSDSWQIRNNIFENTTPSDTTAPRGNEHGIYLGGSYNIVEYNIVRNCYGQGILFNSPNDMYDNIARYNWVENTGSGIVEAGGTRTLIHNNIIITPDGSYENTAVGIVLRSTWAGDSAYIRKSVDAKIYHNTVIAKTPADGKSVIAFQMQSGTAGDPISGAEIKNNIFYAEAKGTGNIWYLYSSAVNLNLPTFNNNVYYAIADAPIWFIDDPSFPNETTFAGWQAHPDSPDPDSINVDPQFTDYGNHDFSIPTGSPAKDIGVKAYDHSLVWLNTDYPQNTRDATPDIGAYEFISEALPIITKDTTPRVCLNIEASGFTTAQWYKDGVIMAGETSLSYQSADLVLGHNSTYYCKISGGGEEVNSIPMKVTYDSAGLNYSMII